MKGTVLLVSCGEEISPALSDALDCWGYRTLVAASSIDAARIARHRRLDMVILDISNGDGVAQEVLRDLRREQPGVVAVLLTACSDFPAAAQAVQGGAYGYPEFVRHIS
ncbi:MAG: response regulator, partial [Clostridia bacterium]|nr:response regulator [Clostridia bacterium]